MWTVLLNTLLIFILRVTDVSLGTMRVMLVTRGFRKGAALIGFVEITIWVIAISKVIGHLTHIAYIIGYSSGFAAGTLCGMWIIEKLSLGSVILRIISITKGADITKAIRDAGYGATLIRAEGLSGEVFLIDVVATRKQVGHLLKLTRDIDRKVFITIEETPQVIGGYQRLSK
ncbi:MAG: DUF5698 domain-containing protein [Chlamydiota bacterium]|nr:DUF5698 domain-containing protein [Chlamydiota bacterium]